MSDECTNCLKCVDACPEAQTLEFKPIMTRRTVSKKVVTIGIVAMFVFIVGLGMATSHWQNRIMIEEHLHHQQNLHSYDHPTAVVEISDLNRKTREKQGPDRQSGEK